MTRPLQISKNPKLYSLKTSESQVPIKGSLEEKTDAKMSDESERTKALVAETEAHMERRAEEIRQERARNPPPFFIESFQAYQERTRIKRTRIYDPKKCKCEGGHTGEDFFCPGNLQSRSNSANGTPMHSPWHDEIMGLVIDEQQPSRRMNDIELESYWSWDSEGESHQQSVASWVTRDPEYRMLAGLSNLSGTEGQSGVGPGQRSKRKRGPDEGPELPSSKRSRIDQSPQGQSSLDNSPHDRFEMRGTEPNPLQDTRAGEKRKRPRDDVGTGPDHGVTRARPGQTALDRLIREEIESMQVEDSEGPEGLPGADGRHQSMAPRSKDTRQERSGRGIVGNQVSPRASATPSPRGVTPAPSMKRAWGKRQVDSAMQRQALKEPRKTRSKKTGTFFALNQKGKLEAVVSRILQQTTTQTRSQKQVEHFELNGKGQPAVAMGFGERRR
ncbi:MAG: hypothetical protein LQ350_006741 [Teloschistes chrysophthalmus]|nr:MAG: hypothetical protein LQ350_006741 [Niorma chrysophthalma]